MLSADDFYSFSQTHLFMWLSPNCQQPPINSSAQESPQYTIGIALVHGTKCQENRFLKKKEEKCYHDVNHDVHVTSEKMVCEEFIWKKMSPSLLRIHAYNKLRCQSKICYFLFIVPSVRLTCDKFIRHVCFDRHQVLTAVCTFWAAQGLQQPCVSHCVCIYEHCRLGGFDFIIEYKHHPY